jgi:hypothetical protein
LETEEYLNQEMLHSENEEFAETAEEEEDFGERFLRKIGKIFAGRKKKTDSRAEGKEEGGKEKKQNHEQIREEVSEVPKHDLPGGITWMEEEYEDTSRTVMMGRKEEVRILTSVSDGRSYSLEKLPVLVGKPGQDVDIVLEFENNSDKDFYGKGNVIRKGGKFYLVGKLQLGTKRIGTETCTSWPTTYPIPPYTAAGASQEITRVFIQDYLTTATFKIGANSLKNAFITVPDLRSTQTSLGLSVDLNWREGLNFSDVVL